MAEKQADDGALPPFLVIKPSGATQRPRRHCEDDWYSLSFRFPCEI